MAADTHTAPTRGQFRPLRFVLWFLALSLVTMAAISAMSAGLNGVEAVVVLLVMAVAAGFLARRR